MFVFQLNAFTAKVCGVSDEQHVRVRGRYPRVHVALSSAEFFLEQEAPCHQWLIPLIQLSLDWMVQFDEFGVKRIGRCIDIAKGEIVAERIARVRFGRPGCEYLIFDRV